MKKIALFPGSFDPITIGHYSVIKRALPLFDEIIVAIGVNSQKKYLFDLEQRMTWLEQCFEGERIQCVNYEGLTIEYAKKMKANFILRGVRNQTDFEYERTIAQMNQALAPQIETVILFTEAKYAAINSTVVRDIIRNGGDVAQFLPPQISI